MKKAYLRRGKPCFLIFRALGADSVVIGVGCHVALKTVIEINKLVHSLEALGNVGELLATIAV